MPVSSDIMQSSLALGLGKAPITFGKRFAQRLDVDAIKEGMKLYGTKPVAPNPTPPPKPYVGKFKIGKNDWAAIDKIQPILDRASRKTGWPSDMLAAQSMVESRAGQNQKSNHLGTIGMFQIIPSRVEPRFAKNNENPDTNAVHAAQMNQWILKNKGHGDTTATLAKYNAGPYSGVESSKYALDIKDIVNQIRSRKAQLAHATKNSAPTENIANNTNRYTR